MQLDVVVSCYSGGLRLLVAEVVAYRLDWGFRLDSEVRKEGVALQRRQSMVGDLSLGVTGGSVVGSARARGA